MSPRTSTRRGRATAAARAGWACVLLAVPERVAAIGTTPPIPPSAVAVLRVLGARQLVQAAATAAVPTGAVARLSAAVDALHAGTGVGLALASPRWRRTAVLDAAVATAFAAVGWSCRRPAVSGAGQRRRGWRGVQLPPARRSRRR
jgi:hypothetical protein